MAGNGEMTNESILFSPVYYLMKKAVKMAAEKKNVNITNVSRKKQYPVVIIIVMIQYDIEEAGQLTDILQ